VDCANTSLIVKLLNTRHAVTGKLPA